MVIQKKKTNITVRNRNKISWNVLFVTTAMKKWSCRICYFFPSSVLKILGEPNSVLPSKIVEDFSIATNRSITVSIYSAYLQSCSIVYLDFMSTFMSQWKSLLLALLQPTSQVTVTSSGRTVKRRFHQLDDDPDQEVSKRFFMRVLF